MTTPHRPLLRKPIALIAACRDRRDQFGITAAVLVVAAACGGSNAPAAPAPRVLGYDITYRVVTEVGAPVTSERHVMVRRPRWSSDITTNASGAPTLAQVTRPGHLIIDRDGALTDLGPQAPRLAPADVGFDLVLPELRKAKLVEARGTRTVAGRTCRLYRTGGPVSDPFAKPTADEFADVCVDDDGLVLFEDWTTAGKHTRTTEAVAVRATAPPESAFEPPGVVDLDAALRPETVVAKSTSGKPGEVADYWRVPKPPWGLRLVQRASVTPLDGPPKVVDLYQAGGTAVIVEHTVGSNQVRDEGSVRRVKAPGLGEGRAFLTWRGPEIVLSAADGLVLVRGNVDLDHLAAFAARLRRQ